jgi:hypothetical protein
MATVGAPKPAVLAVRRFDPSKAKQHCTWLMIGPRGSGKSVVLMDILKKLGGARKFDYGIAMTQTMSTAESFRTLFPDSFVKTEGYDYDASEAFVTASQVGCQAKRPRHGLFVTDDCMFDKGVMKSKAQAQLHLNGRHYLATAFNTTQYALLIPPNIRTNVDYVIALRESNLVNRKSLWQNYFGVFSTFKEFEVWFGQCTQNYGVMVMDRTQASGLLQDMVTFYKVDMTENLSTRIFTDTFYSMVDAGDRVVARREAEARSRVENERLKMLALKSDDNYLVIQT